MSGFNTKERNNNGEYEITFYTESQQDFEKVQDLCRELIDHNKPVSIKGDLISREALKEVFINRLDEGFFFYSEVIKLIDTAPTVDITEEQAIDKLHETGWLPMHDKEMTERPQGKLNEAIKTIKAVCSMQKACIECPMNSNCNEFPQEWKETERGAE